MTIDKQLRQQRGNDGGTTNNKQQSTNVQWQTSNDSRMRWRMTVAEETPQLEQLTSNYGQWRRGNNGTDINDKKQQSTNVQQQRQRRTGGGRQWLARSGV
jgi:hypothetical protein